MGERSEASEGQSLLAELADEVNYSTGDDAANALRQEGPAPQSDATNVADGYYESLPGKSGGTPSGLRSRLRYIFLALAIGIFLAAGDQTIIVSSYGRIGSDFKELDKVSWLATAYLCTTTAFQPLYGKLGDIFGRKACILFSYSLFGLGTLLCGLAQTMNQLIVSRGLTGVGAGGMLTSVSILLSDVVALEERGIWQGYVNMIFACGAGLGAPLGGILTDAVGWRWSFIAQVPFCVIANVFICVLLKMPSHVRDGKATSSLMTVDFLGAMTIISGLILLLVFLDKLASDGTTWATYLWLLVSIVCLSVFLWVEKRVAPQPLTPLHLLFGKDFLGAYLALAFGNMAWYGVIFYVPMLYQAVGHFSPTIAGALLLPGISSGVIGGFVGGALLKRGAGTGFRYLALGSYPLVSVSCALVALGADLFWTQISMAAVVVVLSVSLFVGGLGNGGGMTATLVVVVAVASPENQAVVTACIYLYRQLGATVGLAMISLLFQRVLAVSLVRRLRDTPGLGLNLDEVVRGVRESLDYLERLPSEARLVVESAYGDACQACLCLCAGFAVCAVAFACFMKEKRGSNI